MQQEIFSLEWQQAQPQPRYRLYQLPHTAAWSLTSTSSSYLLFTTLRCRKQGSSPSFSSTTTCSPSPAPSAPYFRISSPSLPEFSPACFSFTFLKIFSVRVGRAVELSSEWCFSTWSNAKRSCSSREAFSPTASRLESSLRYSSSPTRVRDLGSKAAELRSRFSRYFALSSLFRTPPSPWNFSFLFAEGSVAASSGLSATLISSSSSPFTFFRTSSYFRQSSTTSPYISAVYPFHRSRFISQLILTSFTTSSAAMFLLVNFAASFRGRSVQYLRTCPIAPQFSQAPLRKEVDWGPFSVRLYQSSMKPLGSRVGILMSSPPPFESCAYHGSCLMNCGVFSSFSISYILLFIIPTGKVYNQTMISSSSPPPSSPPHPMMRMSCRRSTMSSRIGCSSTAQSSWLRFLRHRWLFSLFRSQMVLDLYPSLRSIHSMPSQYPRPRRKESCF